MEFEGFESSSIRREQNDPYDLASNMIDDAFSDDDVSQDAAHEWFNMYFDTVVGQEVYATSERLRLVLLQRLTLEELFEKDDMLLWFMTSDMVRPIGIPNIQFAKIELKFSLNNEQQLERERLRWYREFVVDEKAYRQQLLMLYHEIAFSIDYEFYSAHAAYEQLPVTDIAAHYYDLGSDLYLKNSHVDDGDFCEHDLLTRPELLTAPERILTEEEMIEAKDEMTTALMAALHAGAVADALVTAERMPAPHLIEAVEYQGNSPKGEPQYRFIEVIQ